MSFADFVLFLHLAIVVFNASLLILIPLGARHWAWVRWMRLRQFHAAMMLLIAAQTAIGQHCPLTILEANLRGETPTEFFLARMIESVLYWNLPMSFFALLYGLCLAWVVGLWYLVPPRRVGREAQADTSCAGP